MYDIIFICGKCGVHLTADENDVGFTLPCPGCDESITVPTGDILFDCPQCGKTLLASKDSGDRMFHCPGCETSIAVPRKGKKIKLSNELAIPGGLNIEPSAVQEDPVEVPDKIAQESGQEAAKINPDKNRNTQFMTTWGDYLAASGLTEDDDEKQS